MITLFRSISQPEAGTRRRMGCLLALLLALLVFSGCGTDAGRHTGGTNGERVPGEYVVELASHETDPVVLHRVFGEAGLTAIQVLETARSLYLLRMDPDPGLQAISELAATDPDVKRVQPNFRYPGTQDNATESPEASPQ